MTAPFVGLGKGVVRLLNAARGALQARTVRGDQAGNGDVRLEAAFFDLTILPVDINPPE